MRPGLGTWAALAAALSMTLTCSPPADPLAFGTLCLPERRGADGLVTCASQVTTKRPNPFGRNAIDFTLTNRRDAQVIAFVLAGPAALFEGSGADMGDMGERADMNASGADNRDAFQFLGIRSYQPLQPRAVIRDRFVPTELGRSREVALALDCGGLTSDLACDLELEYVFMVEPTECAANEDCDGLWTCDISRGECVECLETAQCGDGQTCELGRCSPERQPVSCGVGQVSAAAASKAHHALAWWALLAAAALASRRRRKAASPAGQRSLRRALGRRVSARAVRASLASAIALATLSYDARAARAMSGGDGPDTIGAQLDGPQTRLSLSLGPRLMSGRLGELTNTGVGFAIRQGLRGRHLGADLTLTTAYFTTLQAAPPTSRSLITYSAQVGPRGYLPLGWMGMELFAGASYERLGLASNSLVRATGTRVSYHAAVAAAGLRASFSSLEVELEGQHHWLIGLPGDMISINVTVGFLGR